MSTRSRIGYVDGDYVRSVYCHSDGYLEYNGRILFEHYGNLEAVKSLVALGDISFLGETLDYMDEEHPEGTRDYHRWRNEEIRVATSLGIKNYFRDAFDGWEEYAYLFIPAPDGVNGRWVYKPHYADERREPFDLEADLIAGGIL